MRRKDTPRSVCTTYSCVDLQFARGGAASGSSIPPFIADHFVGLNLHPIKALLTVNST